MPESSGGFDAVLWKQRGYWVLTVYGDAREASGSFRSAARLGGPAEEPDPGRSAVEGARRARVQIRRYCAANRLNRLGTLTYAEACHDQEQVRADVAAFFKRLRRAIVVKELPAKFKPGDPFPYLWVPEWHPGGHGLHLHFAVGRYIPRQAIEQAWGHGFITIRQLNGLSTGSGPLEEARLTARYLAKYAAKDLDDQARRFGLHRYEVAEGFQPVALELQGRSPEELIEQASALLGCKPKRVSHSANWKQWQGPPSFTVEWPG
jgi:hypothetical protein